MKTMHWAIIGIIAIVMIILIMTRKVVAAKLMTFGLLALCLYHYE